MTCLHPENSPLTGYVYGCRCDRCRSANNAYQRAYQRQRREQTQSAALRVPDLGPIQGPSKPLTSTFGYLYTHAKGAPTASPNGLLFLHRAWLFWKIGPEPCECVDCGKFLDWGVNLVVGHLDGDVSNNDPDNLVPVCHGCNLARRRA